MNWTSRIVSLLVILISDRQSERIYQNCNLQRSLHEMMWDPSSKCNGLISLSSHQGTGTLGIVIRARLFCLAADSTASSGVIGPHSDNPKLNNFFATSLLIVSLGF